MYASISDRDGHIQEVYCICKFFGFPAKVIYVKVFDELFEPWSVWVIDLNAKYVVYVSYEQ